MSFSFTTYNILATAYLSNGRYRTPPALLVPAVRHHALLERIAQLDADILCLQEVEPVVFELLMAQLATQGYSGHFDKKAGNKPDGCATFFRTSSFELINTQRVEYADDENGPGKHSGLIASIVSLRHPRGDLTVANTHLRWDAPATPRENQISLRQMTQLLGGLPTSASAATLICGDFNQAADAPACKMLRTAGFEHAHLSRPLARSCVANNKAVLIDFIFHTPSLLAAPIDPPVVDDQTILPNEVEPSDHLPLQTLFDWGA